MSLPDTTSATLVVPAQIDALVINEPLHNAGQTWNQWEMSYNKLNDFLDPMPVPFTNQILSPPDIGVHVHWAVPDGLTHGVEDPAQPGEFVYPYLPNRWLVVRLMTSADAPTAPPVATAWVVKSDALGAPDGARYLNPDHEATGTDVVEPITLGTSMTLADWQASGDTGSGKPPFLTAIAPGNLSFVGFVPGNRNVLSFHDPLTGIDAGTLSYQVLGWYTDPAADPLTGRTAPADDTSAEPEGGWIASVGPNGEPVLIATNLDWSVAVADGDAPPTVTAVSGLVHGVTWDRQNPIVDPVNYPKNISETVRVSVGATQADALAALIREQAIASGVPEATATFEADLLEAFQMGKLADLDTPGGQETVSRHLHDATFGKASGGYTWAIVPTPQADTSNTTPPPPLTPAQNAWLAALNETQAELDLQIRVLTTMQDELSNLWWKNERIARIDPFDYPVSETANFENAKKHLPAEVDPQNPDGWYAKTMAQKAKVDGLRAQVPLAAGDGSAASIEAYARGVLDPDKYELKPSPAPTYAAPHDPVMLISGLGRSERFGHDGVLDCRLAGDLVHGLSAGGKDLTTATMPAGAVPQLDASALPALANGLVAEAYWLSPADAATIADQGLNSTDAAVVASISDALSDTPPQGVLGTPPAAIGNQAWTQPWLPLYLEWSVDFYFTFDANPDGTFKTQPNGDYLFDRAHWAFDGNDYNWTGGALQTQQHATFTGRTILTPNSSFTFMKRLEEYLSKNPNAELENVEEIAKKLSEFDVLSQTMTGLTAQMAMMNPGANVAPPEAMADVLGAGGDTGVPYMDGVQDQDRRNGHGSPFFFPLRAGFLQFQNMRITDSFGRTLPLSAANNNPAGKAQDFKPIQGRGMAPNPDEVGAELAQKMLRLAPRFVHPARLDFTWISADDDTKAVSFVADTTPVCGWLLPNHLDKSLAVYDAEGAYLGEVLTVFIAQGQDRITWIPAPGNPATSPVVTPNTQPDIGNTHLDAIITQLLAQEDGPTALAVFLEAIDETLWTVQASSAKADRDLATIIGRPIAVTRVNVAMDMRGQAMTNQAFYKTYEPDTDTLLQDTGSLEIFTWPVRFGSQAMRRDGTIGYFKGDDYTQFNTVHLPQKAATPTTPFVRKIGEGNYIDLPLRPEAASDAPEPFARDGSQYLTLLLDPNGSVNAATGVLPSLEVTLDERYVDTARDAIAVTFRTGPLIVDVDTVRLPMPAVTSGDWSWLQPTGTQVGDWQTDAIVPADAVARLDAAPPVLREGWLRFVPEDPG